MEAPNTGPDWIWTAIPILALIGIIALLVWIIKGIIWLFNHIQIV